MDNWGLLFPILLSDVLNPVLFTFMVYAAGSKRPVAASASMLLGHTVAYIASGVILALTIEKLANRLANPQTIDFVIEFVIACALFWLVLHTRKDKGKRPDEQTPEFTEYLAANADGRLACLEVQELLDGLVASGEALADAAWSPDVGLAVRAVLGCGEIAD